MKRHTVLFSPEAEEQLSAIYRYMASAAAPMTAANYTNAIVNYCESLQMFPERGNRRDDIRPGLRVTNYRKRTLIAFTVEDDDVLIIGVFWGGQDFETALLPDAGPDQR